MKIGSLDTDKEILIIAEIGNNHEGNFALAEEMIGRAAQAGANAVKFQTIVPHRLVSVLETERIKQLEKFRFSPEQFKKLKRVADREKIIFLSTPFDTDSVKFLNALVPAFKIASGDNNFYPLIDAVARTGKPILLSGGFCGLPELRKTKDFIEKIWEKEKIRQALAILHCVVSYPTPADQANLLALRDLLKLGVTVGYSDHTLGIEAAVLSVALGARIIEKHFTIDKHYSDYRDHQLSADPQELAEMVKRIRGAEILLGGGVKRAQEAENALLGKVRRSVVARMALNKGTVLRIENLDWVRPGQGMPPGSEKKMVGKILKRSIAQGEMICSEDLTEARERE